MKLLVELQDSVTVLKEGKDSKQLYLEGISIQADIVNGNGRKYPLSVAEAAINKYMTERFNKDVATGELNHPKVDAGDINPDRISHKFTEIRQDGKNWITKARILNTTCGKQVKNLIEGEVKLGMSSRGFGKTNLKDRVAIVENLYLVTMADIVVNPSAPDAWQQAIYENQEWVYENGVLVQKDVEPIIDEVKQAMSNTTPKQRNKIIVELFKKYLETISIN